MSGGGQDEKSSLPPSLKSAELRSLKRNDCGKWEQFVSTTAKQMFRSLCELENAPMHCRLTSENDMSQLDIFMDGKAALMPKYSTRVADP